MQARKKVELGKVRPKYSRNGEEGLVKARKSLGPSRDEKEKGKCDDVQQRWSFKISTSGHSTSVGLFKRDSLQKVLISLADVSTAQNTGGNYLWSVRCVLLNIIIEENLHLLKERI